MNNLSNINNTIISQIRDKMLNKMMGKVLAEENTFASKLYNTNNTNVNNKTLNDLGQKASNIKANNIKVKDNLSQQTAAAKAINQSTKLLTVNTKTAAQKNNINNRPALIINHVDKNTNKINIHQNSNTSLENNKKILKNNNKLTLRQHHSTLTEKIQELINNQSTLQRAKIINVTINSKHLGSINVQLIPLPSEIQANITVSNNEAFRDLQQEIDRLKKDLNKNNNKKITLNILVAKQLPYQQSTNTPEVFQEKYNYQKSEKENNLNIEV